MARHDWENASCDGAFEPASSDSEDEGLGVGGEMDDDVNRDEGDDEEVVDAMRDIVQALHLEGDGGGASDTALSKEGDDASVESDGDDVRSRGTSQ